MKQQGLMGQVLVELGLITKSQLEAALSLQKQYKERLGELLLSLKFISEVDILNILAERYRIHYISSGKLADIEISADVLAKVSKEFALEHHILPLMYDDSQKMISVLSNHPKDPQLIGQIKIHTGCEIVSTYLAMKPCIMAGIKKFYENDVMAFANLEDSTLDAHSLLSFGDTEKHRAAITPQEVGHNSGMRLADEVVSTSLMTDNLYVETLNILISMLERNKVAFRGHSASVARLVKKVSEKMKLKPRDVYYNVVAAYFHDIGKREGIHHSLINLKTESDLKLAQKFYLAPVRLIDTANFPRAIPLILTHLFERVDSKGFPEGLLGDKIPLGSRIIAVVDAYEDLVRNPDWSNKSVGDILQELFLYQGTCFDYQVLKSLNQVLMEGQKGTGIAPGENGHNLILIDSSGDTYSHMISRFKEAGFRLMVARDTDSAVGLLRQSKIDGIISDVNSHPLSGVQLCKALKSNPATKAIVFAIISDQEETAKNIQTAIAAGADEFFSRPLKVEIIVAKMKLHLMRRQDSLTEMQAQITPSRATVTGNLSELALADVIQLLSNGRKTGMLALRQNELEAKIFISDGNVINCFYKGKIGEKAFYPLLSWEEGEFALETDCTMPDRIINLPTESLMLEGFRLLDESRAGR